MVSSRFLAFMVVILLLMPAAFAAPAAPAAAPRNDAWVVIGPGGGGAQFIPTVSPHDPNIVMVRCDMTGSYISKDAGMSWRMCNFRSTSDFFVFDPVDPKTIYLGSVGLYRSSDTGDTWELVYPAPDQVKRIWIAGDHGEVQLWGDTGPLGSVQLLAVDPADSDVLYAAMMLEPGPDMPGREGPSGRLAFAISSDKGKTWKEIGPLEESPLVMIVDPSSPADNRVAYLAGASGVSVLKDGKLARNANAEGMNFVNAAGGIDSKTGAVTIYASARPQFRRQPRPPQGAPEAPSAAPAAGAPGQRAAAARGAAASEGAGTARGTAAAAPSAAGGPPSGEATPASTPGGAPRTRPGLDPEAMREMMARSGLFVTRDGGASWEKVSDNITGGAEDTPVSTGAIGACFNKAEVAYVTCGAMGFRGGGGFRGVAKTTDGGKTWECLEEKSFVPYPDENVAWMYNLYRGGDRVSPTHIGVDPNNPDVVFGTDLGRTVKSSDGGYNWVDCSFAKAEGTAVTTRGLDVTTCYGYHIDPFNPKRHIISYTDIGAFKSEDGGATWDIGTENVPRGWRNTTYWVEFDPKVEGLAWGVFGRNHDLPRPKMWRSGGVSRYQGGVAITTDAGASWTASTEGMPESACTHVLMDPESPVGSRTLYVCGFGTGVWKSTDNGKTWTKKNNGIEGEEPFAWRIVRDKNGVLYLIVARRSEDGSYGNEEDGALYRSRDGAENWERIALPEGLNGPNGLLVDPDDPKRLYLAVWGRYQDSGAVTGGIWLSEDAGKTWKYIFDRDQYVYDVTNDPRNPDIMYACGFSSSAWRSEDRGKTWSRIRGYNFKWGHRVVPDPENPNMIYITTFGGSVWYGPAKGDPKAAEDIVTPQVAYGR